MVILRKAATLRRWFELRLCSVLNTAADITVVLRATRLIVGGSSPCCSSDSTWLNENAAVTY